MGNYLIITVVASFVALVPVSTSGGMLTPQYITFVVLSALLVGLLTWWYGARDLKNGALFGVTGFLVTIVTAFITGVASVFAQTGSFSAIAGVLPNFLPFLMKWSTLVSAAYWILPAAALGWYMQQKGSSSM